VRGPIRTIALLGAAAGVLALAATAPAKDTDPTYRFVVKPIVPIEPDSSGGPAAFSVFARLNRAVPRDRFGAPRASLTVADSGGTSPVGTIGRRVRHCYETPIDPSFGKSQALRHPRPGRSVVVRLYVAGHLEASAKVGLSRKRPSASGFGPYARALGC
jgi:hypothetical protein